MLNDYKKRVGNGQMDKDVTERLKNTKLAEAESKQKAEEAKKAA